MVGLVLVLDPKELSAAVEPVAPDEAPMDDEDPIEPLLPMDDEDPAEEELPEPELPEEGMGEVLAAGGIVAGVVVSSAFLPQAPNASKAANARDVATTGLGRNVGILVSFELRSWIGPLQASQPCPNLDKGHRHPMRHPPTLL